MSKYMYIYALYKCTHPHGIRYVQCTCSSILIYDPCMTYIHVHTIIISHTCTCTCIITHKYLLMVLVTEWEQTFPGSSVVKFDLWPHRDGQYLQNVQTRKYTSIHDKISVLHTYIYTVHTCILAPFPGPFPFQLFYCCTFKFHAEACTDHWQPGNGPEINPGMRG